MVELSPRQKEIAALVAQGMTEREIAQRLGLAIQTIKNHKQVLYAKLGARNAAEMVTLLYEAS
jgi:DNA-binding CsgD family transcriptional regulator